MASITQSKISVPNKKDSTVAIVIGQQRRVSETKNPTNVPETTLKSTELSKEISKSLDLGVNVGSSLEVIASQTRKKFLINDILQQKSFQEQSLPPSHNRLQLMSLLNIGICLFFLDHTLIIFNQQYKKRAYLINTFCKY